MPHTAGHPSIQATNAGAHTRPICSPPRCNDLDRVEHRHTINSGGMAAPRLVEGQVTTNWKKALAQLALAYPDRIEPYL